MQASDVPMGVLNPIEPVLLSRKLWDDNRIVMVMMECWTASPGEDKEGVPEGISGNAAVLSAKGWQGRVLEFACSFEEEIRDDMTVLAAGIWKKVEAVWD